MRQLGSLDRYLLVLVVVLLTVSSVYFVVRALPVAAFPYPLVGTESAVFDQARRITDHPGQFPDVDSEPYIVDRYPPAYPFLLRHLPAASGRPFTSGRVLSLVATLVSALGIGLLVRRAAQQGGMSDAATFIPAVLAAGVFLALPDVDFLGSSARPEAVALAFGVMGFLTIHSKRRAMQWLGVVLLAGCILSCHTFLVLPVVALASLWWRTRQQDEVSRFPLLVAAILLVSVLVAVAITGGRMYTHLVTLSFANHSSVRMGQYWLAGMGDWQVLFLFVTAFSFVPVGGRGGKPAVAVFVAFLVLAGGCELQSRMAHRDIGTTQDAIAEKSEEIKGLLGAIEEATRNKDQAGMKLVPEVKKAQEELVALQHEVHEIATEGIPAGRFRLLMVLLGFGVLVCAGSRFRRADSRAVVAPSHVLLGNDTRGLLLALGVMSACLLSWEGTDVGTRLEFLAVLAIVSTAPLMTLRPVLRVLMVALLLVLSFGHLAGMKDRPIRAERRGKLELASAQLQTRLRMVDGSILSMDPQVPLLVGQPLRYQPFMKKLHDVGVWDPEPLVKAIERKQFHAIVLVKGSIADQPFAMIDGMEFPDEVLNAVLKNYDRREGANVTLADGLLVKRYEIMFRK